MFKYLFDELLKEERLTRRWLAEQLGMNELSLNTKFRRNNFSVEDSFNIAHVLNIPPDLLQKVFFEQSNWRREIQALFEHTNYCGMEILYVCDNGCIFLHPENLADYEGEGDFCPCGCSIHNIRALGMEIEEIIENLIEDFGFGENLYLDFDEAAGHIHYSFIEQPILNVKNERASRR